MADSFDVLLAVFMIVTIPGCMFWQLFRKENRGAILNIKKKEIFGFIWLLTGILDAFWFVWAPICDLLSAFGIIIHNTYIMSDSHWFCQVQSIPFRMILVVLLLVNVVGAFRAYNADKKEEESEGNSTRWLWAVHLFYFLLPDWWIIWLITTWV